MYPGIPLITSDSVKTRLGIELDDDTYDELLPSALALVTHWFEAYCQRGLAQRAVVGEVVEDVGLKSYFYVWAFPSVTLSKVVIDGAEVDLSQFKVNSARGVVVCKDPVLVASAESIVVDYTGGYAQSSAPDDLAQAYALAVASRIGYTVSSGSSSSVAIRSIGLGGGALSVQFDTARATGGYEGAYDVANVPVEVQQYASTLDRYRRIAV